MIHTNSFNSIYRKYPNQFPKNVINCELGWIKIVEDMCAAIKSYLDYEENCFVDQVVFQSIKEKFGVLDISFIGGEVGAIQKHFVKSMLFHFFIIE